MSTDQPQTYRLNKYIAHCGICSRRQAADLVKSGLVEVNGQVERNPAVEVTKNHLVKVRGQRIKIKEKKIYILLNKPKNVITTTKDERGRKTVLDLVKNKIPERIYPVGRLDRNTTGLLVLTNDGDLAKKMAHPKHKMKKIYQVYLDKPLTKRHLNDIMNGLELEDGYFQPDALNYVEGMSKKDLVIALHSGKNRIIRRLFAHLNYEVVKLDRVLLAGLTKKDLPRGRFRHLRPKEVIMLKHFHK